MREWLESGVKLFELLIPACFLIYFDDLRTQMAMLFFSLPAVAVEWTCFRRCLDLVGPRWTFIQKQYPNLVNLPYAKNVYLDLWKAYITNWLVVSTNPSEK